MYVAPWKNLGSCACRRMWQLSTRLDNTAIDRRAFLPKLAVCGSFVNLKISVLFKNEYLIWFKIMLLLVI